MVLPRRRHAATLGALLAAGLLAAIVVVVTSGRGSVGSPGAGRGHPATATRTGSSGTSVPRERSRSTSDPPTTDPTAQVPPPPGAGRLEFADRFGGSRLDRSKWNTYITSAAASGRPWNANGHGGSGPATNQAVVDLEYDLPSQIEVRGGLRIKAVHQATPGMLGTAAITYPWRSGAVSTYGKFQFDGGYLQVEAKVPTAPGMWPGLFLLPGAAMAGAPDTYEIDLLEGGYLGKAPPEQNVAWHLHTPQGVVGGVTDVDTNLSGGVHTYGLAWVPGKSLTWYFDGRAVGKVTSAEAPVPSEPMELILDLQVAGPATRSFHSLPDARTPSAATMLVKGVQVYALR